MAGYVDSMQIHVGRRLTLSGFPRPAAKSLPVEDTLAGRQSFADAGVF
jgi:hypothetical protein